MPAANARAHHTAQVLIINFLGMFFKVEPLNWQEWLVTVAIGSGALLWSFIVRLLSRNIHWSCGCCAPLGAALGRLNRVQTKQAAAAEAVYAPRAGGVELTVQEAVSLARGTAQAADAEEDSKKSKKESRKRRGRAGSKEERTLSGRSDSAGSLGGRV